LLLCCISTVQDQKQQSCAIDLLHRALKGSFRFSTNAFRSCISLLDHFSVQAAKEKVILASPEQTGNTIANAF
jgi:hypothetical protein